MKRILLTLPALALALSACGAEEETTPSTFTSATSSSAQTSSESSEPTSSSTQATQPTFEEAEPAAEPAEPYVVECLEGTPGPALWSDGSKEFSQYCFDQLGGEEVLEHESNAGCPAAICGYGTDEHGNPNPTSGEIQTMHGCEAGYITDEELCQAVAEKLGDYTP
ncbi:MAG: hypothetical protein SPJ78_02220 [Corynebacterium camporealensis]|uniref:hypothetical protein n=1 Tax=Corynebacterium camporealensis TaxID=161896 RepID=UPI002A90DFA8|nr:hypothetical protein [Corynebacterium camporealensis]MDY5839529.1 hypothetical protein [Corynebacterium camporealensis]